MDNYKIFYVIFFYPISILLKLIFLASLYFFLAEDRQKLDHQIINIHSLKGFMYEANVCVHLFPHQF